MNVNSRMLHRRSLESVPVFLAAVLAVAAASWLALAATVTGPQMTSTSVAPVARAPGPAATTRPHLAPLVAKSAGLPLIRPAQVVAAVKDDGSAERLLKRLRLQGVTQVGDDLVAYVLVEKEGLRTLRENQRVLEFNVEKIEIGRVTLSLRGVTVTLGHN